MINHNALLNDLLNRTLEVKFQDKLWKSNYAEADLFELWRFLQHKDRKYPVIWLQTGYVVNERRNSNRITLQGCKFFFITKGDSNDYYKRRFQTTYQEILYPLKDLFIKSIEKSKGISYYDDFSFITFPFNDVSELSARDAVNGSKRLDENSIGQDYWDSLLLNIDLTISTGCYPEYNVIKK
ncbi:hypothetical protein CMU45_02640 [Elizabethkingia anophelis]|nr:hypothetical protein [Elizabethkingia anophelis]MDV3814185.1 hypothetical protein [Elizabethkingia anophelis]